MCLGDVGRVVRMLDERTVVVECTGRDATGRGATGREFIAALDVLLAEGVEVSLGDVVVVSMGFVLAITDDAGLADGAGPSEREEART